MSQANVEIVRSGIEAFNRRDIEVLISVLHSEIDWNPGMPGTSRYRGHEGVRRMLREVETAWKDLQIVPGNLVDRGDVVVAVCKLTATGRTSEVSVEGDQVGLIDLVDGLFTRVRIFTSEAEALKAVGLSE